MGDGANDTNKTTGHLSFTEAGTLGAMVQLRDEEKEALRSLGYMAD
jgi:hypothetical protein